MNKQLMQGKVRAGFRDIKWCNIRDQFGDPIINEKLSLTIHLFKFHVFYDFIWDVF